MLCFMNQLYLCPVCHQWKPGEQCYLKQGRCKSCSIRKAGEAQAKRPRSQTPESCFYRDLQSLNPKVG